MVLPPVADVHYRRRSTAVRVKRQAKAWPKAANALSRRLNRLAPLLREAGIEYAEDEVGHGKRKLKTLRKIDDRGGEEGSQDGAPPDERPSSERYEEVEDDDDGFEFDPV